MDRSQLIKIFWITVSWTLIAVFQTLGVHAHLTHLERDVSDLDLWLYLQGAVLTGLLAGIIGGSGVVLLWERWLRSMTYGWSLLNLLWTYTLIYLVVGIPSQLFIESTEQGLPFPMSSFEGKL